MASEIRVNRVSNRSGLSTITFANGGVQFSGITTFANGDFRVGTGATILNPSTNEMQFHTGGSSRLTINNSGATIGALTATTGTFSSNVSIGGVLTYEDVKNVDAIGIVTARTGAEINGGDLKVGTAVTFSAVTGNVTQDVGITTYSGSAVWFKGATANKDMYWSHASGATVYKDNAQILMGDSSDLQIYHNGSSSFISDEGQGSLKITTNGTGVDIQKGSSETIARFIADGAVELYNNNVKTFETTTDGVTVKGSEGGSAFIYVSADEGDDNADKWRHLATVGGQYFLSNYASGGWEHNIGCTGNGAVELYYDSTKTFETTSGGATVTGSSLNVINPASSGDSRLYIKAGLNGTSYILFHADEGDNDTDKWRLLAPNGGPFALQYHDGSWENSITATNNGAVNLYHNDSKKLETTSSGVTVTGDMNISDGTGQSHYQITQTNGNTVKFGIVSGSDIELSGSSNNSIYFKTNNTERVRITAGGYMGINTDSPARPLHIVGNDGATGATIGNSDTQLVIDNTGSNGAIVEFLSSTTGAGRIFFTDTGGTNRGRMEYSLNGDYLRFDTSGSEKLRIDSSGNMGLGTGGGIDRQFHIQGTHPIIKLEDTGGGYSEISANTAVLSLRADAGNSQSSSYINFEVDGTERVRIDSAGKIGVGQSPNTKFNVALAAQQADGTDDASDWGAGGIFQLDATGSAANGNEILFAGAHSGGVGQIASGIGFGRENTGNWGTYLSFKTHSTGTSNIDELNEALRITSDRKIDTGSKTITGGTNLAIQNFRVKGIWSGTPSIGKEIELISGYDGSVKMAAIGYNLTDTGTGSTYGGDLVFHTQPLYSSPTTPIPETMRISSSGYITKTKQPRAHVLISTQTQLGNSKITAWASPTINVSSFWDSTNKRFVAPCAGVYMFGGNFRIGAPGHVRVVKFNLQIYNSGGTHYATYGGGVGGAHNYDDSSSGWDHPYVSFTNMIQLSKADYVELHTSELAVQHTSYIQTNNNQSGMWGFLLM